MRKPLKLLALIVLFAALSSISTFGNLRIQKQACRSEPFCDTQLILRNANATTRFDFGGGIKAPATLDAWRTVVPGVPAETLVAVAGSLGGSDVRFEAAVIGLENGKPVELSPRLRGSSQDALCIGRYRDSASIFLINFVWGDESHYAAHVYRASVYRWNGRAFVKASQWATKLKHPTWKSACHELGVKCERNFFERVLKGNDP
jgi:hypothetical protein